MPAWLHTLTPCPPPAVQHSQTFFSPNFILVGGAGSGPASAPTCTLSRCCALARPLVSRSVFVGRTPWGSIPMTAPRLPVSATMHGTDGGWLTCCQWLSYLADEA